MTQTTKPPYTIVKGSIFGENFVYPSSKKSESLAADLIMKQRGVIGEIKIETMERFLNGTLEECIARNEKAIHKKGTMIGTTKPMAQLITKFDLNDFIFLKKIGEGQFGTVFVVKDRNTNKLHALKAISISQVNDDGLEKHIIVAELYSVRKRRSADDKRMPPLGGRPRLLQRQVLHIFRARLHQGHGAVRRHQDHG